MIPQNSCRLIVWHENRCLLFSPSFACFTAVCCIALSHDESDKITQSKAKDIENRSQLMIKKFISLIAVGRASKSQIINWRCLFIDWCCELKFLVSTMMDNDEESNYYYNSTEEEDDDDVHVPLKKWTFQNMNHKTWIIKQRWCLSERLSKMSNCGIHSRTRRRRNRRDRRSTPSGSKRWRKWWRFSPTGSCSL